MRKMGSDSSIENDKRRQALPPFLALGSDSRLFFERIVSVRKNTEFAFFRKNKPKEGC